MNDNMTYAQLVDWIIRQDESVQRLYYWASQTVKMFWYPEHFTVERIIERLGGLHISSENDDYDFDTVYNNLWCNDELYGLVIALTRSGATYNHSTMRQEVLRLLRALMFDNELDYGVEQFISYLCLVELYNQCLEVNNG
jgi:hypothetical protein